MRMSEIMERSMKLKSVMQSDAFSEPLNKMIIPFDEVDDIINLINYGTKDAGKVTNNYGVLNMNPSDRVMIYKGWYQPLGGEKRDGYILIHITNIPTQGTTHRWFAELSMSIVAYGEDGCTIRKDLQEFVRVNDSDKFGYVYDKNVNKYPSKDSMCKRYGITKPDGGGCRPLISLTYDTTGFVDEAYSSDYSIICEYPHNDAEISETFEMNIKLAEQKLIARFSTGDLPPADDIAWYAMIATVDPMGGGDHSLEDEILGILKKRKYIVWFEDRRDEYGLISRTLKCDGETMCTVVFM